MERTESREWRYFKGAIKLIVKKWHAFWLKQAAETIDLMVIHFRYDYTLRDPQNKIE